MITATANPLLPAAYDVVWAVLALVCIALVVWALTSLARASGRSSALSGGNALLWVLFIFFFPVLGSCVWLLFGRGRALARSPARVRGSVPH